MNNPLELGMQDPNMTAPLEIVGGGPYSGKQVPDLGASKITKTDMSGESGQPMHTSNDASMQAQGMAPSGENSSGIPAAQPVEILTYGDPNNTASL